MKERNNSPLGLYTLGIFVLYIAAFLMLVILGARTYRSTVSSQDRNYQTRAQLSWLSAVIRANDREGAVSLKDTEGGQDGQVLIVRDGSGYASRIYVYDGCLVEDYAAVDAELDPDSALKIGETAQFHVELYPEDNALNVQTDEGWIRLCLRSDGGIAADE